MFGITNKYKSKKKEQQYVKNTVEMKLFLMKK